ncbi:DUF3892 domain-containing protein [Micromonospora profundi]|uniref:DUF3892 domain-containing protein n=1 Tax=Micromonospora profundi TaxID=1420889 RepID=UPI0033A5774A
MTAQLHFLAYVRQGLAAAGAVADPLETDIPARQPVTVGVRLAGRTERTFDIRLYGPGDIRGIDTRQVIRTDPPERASDFEPNNLVTIEFDRPDFPWLFTPAAPGSRQRLRPWLFLVVVPVANSELRTDMGAPLPVLQCALSDLPDLAESWAWAHAQVATTGTGEPVADVLAGDPRRTLSRLISPRRLAAGIAYRACLVPAFEAGRRAGLGLPVDDSAALAPAWTPGLGAAPPLPVYHSWEFSTGADGDFESLVRRLQARALPTDAGLRPMLLGPSGVPGLDPSVPTVTLGAEGALRGALTMPTLWPAQSREAFEELLRALIADTGTRLGPPLYGGRYAGVDRVPGDAAHPHWLRELNLDPRHRIAAALGTRVVREQQEELMAAAWEQAAEVQRANEAVRQAQLATEVSRSTYDRRIAGAAAAALARSGAAVGRLALGGPLGAGRLLQVSGAVLDAVTVTPRGKRLISGELHRNPTATAALSATFRRMTRPDGPLARRAGVAALDSMVEAAASNEVTATPPEQPPTGTVLFDEVAGDDIAFHLINRNRIDRANPWWRGRAAGLAAAATTGAATAEAPAVAADEAAVAADEPALASAVVVDQPAPAADAVPSTSEPKVALAPPASDGTGGDSRPALTGLLDTPVGAATVEQFGEVWTVSPMRPIEPRLPPDDPNWPPRDPYPDPDPIPDPPQPLPVSYPDTSPLPAGVPAQPTGLPGVVLSPPGPAVNDRQTFVSTTDGRLFERSFDGTRWLWFDHGAPTGTQAAGVEPGGVMDGGRRIFVATVHGGLFEHYREDDRWYWRKHPIPPGSYGLGSSPFLVLNNQSIFLTSTTNGGGNRLWERRRNGTQWSWVDHGNPSHYSAEKIVSTPGSAQANGSFFVTSDAGRLWQRYWTGSRWEWRWHGHMAGAPLRHIAPRTAPVSVFGISYDGRLIERVLTNSTWGDHGTPPGTTLSNAPGDIIVSGNEVMVFCGASNGRLYIRSWNGSAWSWRDLGSPPGTTVMQVPGAAMWGRLTVFVTGSDGRLFSVSRTGNEWTWEDQGFPVDSRGAGSIGAEPAGGVRWALPLGFMSNLVAAHVDNGVTDNVIYHRVGRNLGFEAEVRGGWTAQIDKPGPIGWETQGLGIAVADVNGNGQPDLILMWVDNPAGANAVYYQIGWNLGANGAVTGGWSPTYRLPDEVAAEIQGADLAVADLDGDGRPELILAYATGGAAPGLYYRVGWRLDTQGAISRGWSDSVSVPWTPRPVQGVGVAVADLNDNLTPDIVVLTIESAGGANQAVYRIGWQLNARGRVTGGWAPAKVVGGGPLPAAHQGAGIAVMDVTGTRRADLVLFHVANPAQSNRGYYRVGWDLDRYGVAQRWSADAEVPGWFGWEGQGAAVALADLDPALTAARATMGDQFAAAAGRHQDRILAAQALARPKQRAAVDTATLAARMTSALEPVGGITDKTAGRLKLAGAESVEELRELVVVPRFPRPMYEALRDLSQELLFPGVSEIPPETVTLLRVNASFVEAFMVGLNSELGREMLWRRYPTDLGATFFSQFWDVRSAQSSVGPLSDIPPIQGWKPGNGLGENATAVGAGDLLVVLVRGELLRRYPGTAIYVQKATFAADGSRQLADETREPQFAGRLDPDIQFFGLPLEVSEARGSDTDAGWFIVLRQPPTDARFGLDAPPDGASYGGAPTHWSDVHWRHLTGDASEEERLRHAQASGRLSSLRLGGLEWGYNSAHQAQITLQRPVMVAIHASDMIPAIDDTWQIEAVARHSGGVPQHRIVAVGGHRADGTPWRMGTEDVIAAIGRHERFYVERPVGDQVQVLVSRTAAGRPYLTTEADGDLPNNLLSLPELAEDA